MQVAVVEHVPMLRHLWGCGHNLGNLTLHGGLQCLCCGEACRTGTRDIYKNRQRTEIIFQWILPKWCCVFAIWVFPNVIHSGASQRYQTNHPLFIRIIQNQSHQRSVASKKPTTVWQKEEETSMSSVQCQS